MKQLKDHIIEFHLKDGNMKSGRSGSHDVPMSQGDIDIAGIMQEMKRRYFKG